MCVCTVLQLQLAHSACQQATLDFVVRVPLYVPSWYQSRPVPPTQQRGGRFVGRASLRGGRASESKRFIYQQHTISHYTRKSHLAIAIGSSTEERLELFELNLAAAISIDLIYQIFDVYSKSEIMLDDFYCEVHAPGEGGGNDKSSGGGGEEAGRREGGEAEIKRQSVQDGWFRVIGPRGGAGRT